MDVAWLEPAGTMSLHLYVSAVVAASLVIVGRAVTRLPCLERPFATSLLEYLGNIGIESAAERRQNREARVLVGRIADELDKRAVPRPEREAFLNELRLTIRSAAERAGDP